jgi:predicted ATPase/DNA-binding CsgD family transcriptional regulator
MTVHNLPHTAAPFVGRDSELAETSHQLTNTGCRLLTLVGPGGMGKTRLAIRAAQNCADQFEDGVYFVPLQPLDSQEFLCSAIADAVHFSFSAGGDPQQQLLQYLQEKTLLLVLDNFEHLLDGAELLTELLYAAPDIKLLVTSREVLNLQEEWRFLVGGLPYPETDDVVQPTTYSAVQLFVDRARQVRGDLNLADEQAAVIRVCRLVEGMPLALELAAVWTKALRTDEIASEIQHNLDFLSTSLRNVPQRHRSMQAVFEQTWQRLTDEEQRVFSALSVFRGGFRREAAQAVAAMSLRVLSDLVDKSLLTREPDGRYQIHELLRQYAEARLETTPDEANRIHELHAAYYVRFLYERDNDLNSNRQREVALEIEAELDNTRAAWSWTIEYSRFEKIEQAVYPLALFFSFQSRYVEGIDALEKAVQRLDNGDLRAEICQARVLEALGWLCINGGVFEKAQGALERCCQIYSRRDDLPVPREDPRLALSYLYLRQGNFSAAETFCQDALRVYTLRADRVNLINAFYLLVEVARLQGQYEVARNYVRQGYTAETSAIESEELIAISSVHFALGRIALDAGDPAEAIDHFEASRAIAQDRGHDFSLATALEGIGKCACALGNYGEARRCLREALQIAGDRILWLIPPLYVGIGDLFLQTGRQARGVEVLTFALHHPASDYETKTRVQRLLSRYPTRAEAGQQIFSPVDFNALTNALLEELNRPAPQANAALDDPLSERELEILTLIAAGRSNRQIADQLFLTVGTVKGYITQLYSKLGVESRTQALVRARQLNLLL